MSLNLEEKFKTHCNTQNLELNPNQINLVKQLDNFYKENFRSNLLNFFSKQSSKKGFYLYGGVGVVSLFQGGLFLDYTALTGSVGSGQHIGIILVELGVGVTVTSVMLALFHAFAGFVEDHS